ncbi:MAG: hypothetical protein H7144_02065 [Burkholderiales bacterium]|nr:hypothetical protein [Phycisphaerae bacterium]
MKWAKRALRFVIAFGVCAAATWTVAYASNSSNTTWGSPGSILVGSLVIASIYTASCIHEEGV